MQFLAGEAGGGVGTVPNGDRGNGGGWGMNSLVTGATGFVGGTLVKRLLEGGGTVRCLVRKGSDLSLLKELGVDLAEGDVRDYDSTLDALRGVDRVYHCAAAVGIGTVPRGEYYAVNGDGTRNVVRGCEEAGVGVLVHASTQSVTFDFEERIRAGEDSPSYPSRYKDAYSESKALGERAVIEAGRDGRVRAVAIRPTFVWGAGDTLMLPTMAKMARRNQLSLIDGGRSQISPSHVENVCDSMMLAAERDDVSGEAFLVTDDEDVPVGEFTARMMEAIGLPKPTRSIPYGVAFAVAAIVEKIHELPFIRQPPSMSRYGVAIMGLNLTFSCEKAKRMLGYRPRMAMDEGMRGLADWVEESGGVERLIA
jgi:nucleoside-diphosphate-sugar epimerase